MMPPAPTRLLDFHRKCPPSFLRGHDLRGLTRQFTDGLAGRLPLIHSQIIEALAIAVIHEGIDIAIQFRVNPEHRKMRRRVMHRPSKPRTRTFVDKSDLTIKRMIENQSFRFRHSTATAKSRIKAREQSKRGSPAEEDAF